MTHASDPQNSSVDRLNVAVLGFWHVHADDYAQTVERNEHCRLTAVWDDDRDRGEAAAGRYDVPFADDLGALLARDDIDAVTVTTATRDHERVIGAALNAGKHVFTEKLLAPTADACESLVQAATDNDVRLFVSLPRLYEAQTLAIQRLIADGALGDITYTRVRMAHDGWVNDWLPERFADPDDAIGGALTDLGCHPVYLTQLFLGPTPNAIASAYGYATGRAVEDNAVVTATYPNGAIGVVEASFVTTPGAGTIEVRGTAGSVMTGFGNPALLAKGDRFDPDAWSEVDVPETGRHPLDIWVESILAGSDTEENLRAAVELTRFVVAANQAAASGRTTQPAHRTRTHDHTANEAGAS